MKNIILKTSFFNRDVLDVSKDLLGKVLRVKYQDTWLSAMIIETEAYAMNDKASHASLGFTEKRKALFMPPGTIYMYYARGGDSLNFSCKGEGNAVLIKSAIVYEPTEKQLHIMQGLNPLPGPRPRPVERLMSGQTLLCKALNLKVPVWDQRQLDPEQFYIEDVAYQPKEIIHTTRLGIPEGRDGHLDYRFIDKAYRSRATKG